MKKYRVGLIAIFTGEYNKYMPRFIRTFKKYFAPGKAKLYVLTEKNIKCDDENVEIMQINHLGWPNCTLRRYEIIMEFADKFDNEYLFSIDGDVYFKKEILLSEIKGELVGVLHRNIERKRKDFNYETRPESKAYIADNEGKTYFAGGLVGGKREIFLRLAENIRDNMNEDIKKGIRAVWGDESHINRYFIDNEPEKILSPVYMCPDYLEGKKFAGKIIHITKDFKKVNIEDIKDYLNIDPQEVMHKKIKKDYE